MQIPGATPRQRYRRDCAPHRERPQARRDELQPRHQHDGDRFLRQDDCGVNDLRRSRIVVPRFGQRRLRHERERQRAGRQRLGRSGTAHAIVANNGVLTDLGSNVAGPLHAPTRSATTAASSAAIRTSRTATARRPSGSTAPSRCSLWAVGGGYAANGSAYMWNPDTGVKLLDNPFHDAGYDLTATSASFDGSVVIGHGDDFF